MNIRLAHMDDLQAIVNIENACFPPAEACPEESFRTRLAVYPEHFWLLEKENEIIGFINGMVTDRKTIIDEMFDQSTMHNEQGDWQALFGVTILPGQRKNNYAALIMERVIADCRAQGRKGIILTCKEHFISYYRKFGFKNQGVSKSCHGGEKWFDMRLDFTV